MSEHWTPEEDTYLRENHDCSISLVARNLDRTEGAVSYRMRALGLIPPRFNATSPSVRAVTVEEWPELASTLYRAMGASMEIVAAMARPEAVA